MNHAMSDHVDPFEGVHNPRLASGQRGQQLPERAVSLAILPGYFFEIEKEMMAGLISFRPPS